MAWFKVDDKLHDHRKTRTAGTTAMGLWVLAGAWCADNLSDGFIPESVLPRWERNYKKLAAQLVTAGFWTGATRDGEKGWQFHDWTDCNPSRVEVEERRAAARERMDKLRKNKDSTSPEVRANNDSTNTEVLVPVPALPVLDSGSVGVERPETLHAVPATKAAPKCFKHPNGNPTNEACGGCAKIREREERRNEREAQKAADAAADRARNCPVCEGTHFVLDENKMPTKRKCGHVRPSQGGVA